MSRPANVARALNIDTLRLQRLAYLRYNRRDAGITLRSALTISHAEFERAYPRFPEWLSQQENRRSRRKASGVSKPAEKKAAVLK